MLGLISRVEQPFMRKQAVTEEKFMFPDVPPAACTLLGAIAPGEYQVFALASNNEDAYLDETYLEKLASKPTDAEGAASCRRAARSGQSPGTEPLFYGERV